MANQRDDENSGERPTILEEMLLAVQDQDEQDDEDLAEALGVTDGDDDEEEDAGLRD